MTRGDAAKEVGFGFSEVKSDDDVLVLFVFFVKLDCIVIMPAIGDFLVGRYNRL